jgi:Ferritin-like domain
MGGFCGGPSLPKHVTRVDLMRRGSLAGLAMVGGGALLSLRAEAAEPVPSARLDRKILRFALQLEYLQAAFYAAAVDAGSLSGEVLEFAKTVAGHEQEHVDYLKSALGATAGAEPRFDFGATMRDQQSFLNAAARLENIGVAAYNGQAANLTKKSLAAAAAIVSVEGRHAAWVSSLAGRDPAPRAADPGATAAVVTATIKRTGFLR